MQKVEFAISGMTCAGCQAAVTKALAQAPGVREARVNLMAHAATVEFDETATTPERLITAVESAGYGASLPEADVDEAREQERRRLEREAMIALGVGVLAMTVGMATMGDPRANWIWMGVTAFVLAGPGRRFFVKAASALRHGSTNMDVLVALGTGAAFGYSAWQTVRAAHPVYYEAAIWIIALILTGRTLEARATKRTMTALARLKSLAPTTATVVRMLKEEEIPIGQIRVGEIVVIKPGQRVPVDGTVISGASAVDESMLTGEAMPADKASGDAVLAGTMNQTGALRVRAAHVAAQSTLERVVKLLKEAQSSRAPLEALADRVSGWFVPLVVVLALITLAATQSLERAIAVVIISCPCAMGLAVPAAIMVAMGRAADLGVLIKNGEALERLARVDTLAFDKTGTLTEGKPVVQSIERAPDHTEHDVLRWAAAVERSSEHPIAKGVLAEAMRRKITGIPMAENFMAQPGWGAMARVEGKLVAVSKAAEGVGVEVSVDDEKIGRLTFTDPLKAGAKQAVRELRFLKLVMLTGDQKLNAHRVAAELEIGDVRADLKPADKLAALAQLAQEGRYVAMAGDGINDAPALAQSYVGIAMGHGSDIAIEAADVTLLNGSLDRIARAIRLARATVATMRMNLFWAMIYNVIAIPAAAFGLLNPVLASAAMALSSLSVVANSLRLRRAG